MIPNTTHNLEKNIESEIKNNIHYQEMLHQVST